MDALSLVCVKKLSTKMTGVLFCSLNIQFLIYVNDKGEESYNIKMCWIWLCIKKDSNKTYL